MAPSGLQAHNQNHAGLPPGINPQVRPQCSPRWGRFLRSGDLRVTEGIFQERTSKNRERLKAERLAREAAERANPPEPKAKVKAKPKKKKTT